LTTTPCFFFRALKLNVRFLNTLSDSDLSLTPNTTFWPRLLPSVSPPVG